ncbi:sensor histidine kinase [Actinomadura rudentiformis]|uniref:histidine kinase n=1 Tax=Actinomadura rudentiformis TaxID=359158 RepID=A0A6H9Z2C4_9ACTN|nr:histidine kinase [Actinomadura rudentiformis]KAB2347407.1 two-component sensor histidine kinase [Actinomadura rudentiformis]
MTDPGARLDRITSLGGCLVRGTAGALALLFLLLCLVAAATSDGALSVYLGLIFLAAVSAWAALTTKRFLAWTLAAASMSVLMTVYAALAKPVVDNPSMLLEGSGLLVMVVRVIWQQPRERLLPMTVLVGGAVVVMPLRGSAISLLFFSAPLTVLVAIAIGAGLWLRAIDARRARALVAARRDERLELARDLHDFVAHHITGIVVQAQAARFTAGSGAAQDPEQLDTMFAGIEKAGTEALTSMRRMVGLLREAQHTGPDTDATGQSKTRPVGGLTQVEELVVAFKDPPATLEISDELGVLAPEVATSVHRIVQEALTNARKYAADATAVRVGVWRTHEGVQVTVRDNGRGTSQSARRRLPSGGFGLVGLGERVEALGGRIHAGPRPEGGWEVVAVLPDPDHLPQSGP